MDQLDETPKSGADAIAEITALTERLEELKRTAIAQLLARLEQCEQERRKLTQELQKLGYTQAVQNGSGNGTRPAVRVASDPKHPSASARKRFKDLNLGAVVKIILSERGALHGTEIERLAKEGGYKKGTQKFQNYLPVALKREGIFENIGGNTWRLKS